MSIKSDPQYRWVHSTFENASINCFRWLELKRVRNLHDRGHCITSSFDTSRLSTKHNPPFRDAFDFFVMLWSKKIQVYHVLRNLRHTVGHMRFKGKNTRKF